VGQALAFATLTGELTYSFGLCDQFWDGEVSFGIIRVSAATALLMCVIFSVPRPALSQSSSAADHGCFPWQVFQNGQCVAKQAQEPPPLPPPAPAASNEPPPPPVIASPCLDGGYRNSDGQCVCPSGTHPDAAGGRCLTETITRARETPRLPENSPETVVCDGGTVSNGSCLCPSGFSLMPTGQGGGVCARTKAESCLGGQLSVDGKCQCNGQVTMSGETYLLEYNNGKCLPMRCPVTALLRDGKCGTTSSAEPATAPELAGEPKRRPAPKEARDTRNESDEGEHRRRCGRGMVMTRHGCAPAVRRRSLEYLYRQYYL
jgi:hypothetical protein